jgi:NAD-dependent SIR2 family protein deacetylase
MNTLIDKLDEAANLIGQADSLIISAGAGIGVDSGLPDFRGNEGFWQAYPALKQANIDFYKIANPSAFENMPRRAWGFYGHRLNLYRQTPPHNGFTQLLRLANTKKGGYSIFTSNVDGHFQRAGFDKNCINECHGSILHLQCLGVCSTHVWSATELLPDIDEQRCHLNSSLPVCDQCGGLARPNILMFDDWGWVSQRQRTQALYQEQWLETINKPVIIELGAGTTIPSVRRFSERICREFGAMLIRINPNEPETGALTGVSLPLGAVEAIDLISARLDIN